MTLGTSSAAACRGKRQGNCCELGRRREGRRVALRGIRLWARAQEPLQPGGGPCRGEGWLVPWPLGNSDPAEHVTQQQQQRRRRPTKKLKSNGAVSFCSAGSADACCACCWSCHHDSHCGGSGACCCACCWAAAVPAAGACEGRECVCVWGGRCEGSPPRCGGGSSSASHHAWEDTASVVLWARAAPRSPLRAGGPVRSPRTRPWRQAARRALGGAAAASGDGWWELCRSRCCHEDLRGTGVWAIRGRAGVVSAACEQLASSGERGAAAAPGAIVC